ncbi:MAG: hypothetical protein WA421_09430 [Nitrososphaeraceae archaeon]|jgi:hypothetical protein
MANASKSSAQLENAALCPLSIGHMVSDKVTPDQDFRYFKAKEDSYNAITKDGWYIRDAQYDRPIASLEPFKYCPWCSKELNLKK